MSTGLPLKSEEEAVQLHRGGGHTTLRLREMPRNSFFVVSISIF